MLCQNVTISVKMPSLEYDETGSIGQSLTHKKTSRDSVAGITKTTVGNFIKIY